MPLTAEHLVAAVRSRLRACAPAAGALPVPGLGSVHSLAGGFEAWRNAGVRLTLE